jgi:flagellar biosynthesis/type III secretory pathway protein FliH
VWLSGPDEVTACQSAVELLQRLAQLHERRKGELDKAVAAAQAAGYAQGREEALRAVAPQLLQAWQDAARQSRVDLLAWREAAITLSRQIVLHIADSLAPADIVAALARRAAEALAPEQATVVHVHPQVAAIVQAQLAGSDGSARNSTLLEVRADATLEPLDCRFEMPFGEWFVGLEPQLDNVTRAMLRATGQP